MNGKGKTDSKRPTHKNNEIILEKQKISSIEYYLMF